MKIRDVRVEHSSFLTLLLCFCSPYFVPERLGGYFSMVFDAIGPFMGCMRAPPTVAALDAEAGKMLWSLTEREIGMASKDL